MFICPDPAVTMPELGFLPKITSCRSQNKTRAHCSHCCVCCSSVHPGPCKLQSRDSVGRVLKLLVFKLSQNYANITCSAFGEYFGIPKVGLAAGE